MIEQQRHPKQKILSVRKVMSLTGWIKHFYWMAVSKAY